MIRNYHTRPVKGGLNREGPWYPVCGGSGRPCQQRDGHDGPHDWEDQRASQRIVTVASPAEVVSEQDPDVTTTPGSSASTQSTGFATAPRSDG